MPRSATCRMPRPFRATSPKPPTLLAVSTFSSTTPRGSVRPTTRPDGPPAFRSTCWRRCARRGRRSSSLETAEAGVILNISSISGFRASVRTPPYGAVKAAILEYTLTQETAALAPKRIRVNCIAPGSIEFPGGTWARAKANNPDLYGRILGSIPFGRGAGRKRWRKSPCSCARRSPAGLPAKTSPSMAGRCSSEGKCSLGGLVHAYLRRSRRAHARRP